ncbi:UNVERIFIED_CONTAM: hypothetical protein PYX00_001043 [Menopon gallinae]|uniref:RING-type domain-containing protein n=1 Tax=Menopon gallinae TaxID=328185 RepID=A0AAW2ICJ0_9NEOP
MAAVNKHKIKLREVNRHLVCRLCRGYYVDATTIAECLHSFCRSCIIKYLEKNSFCPICEVQIHTAKPHLSLRQDKALQDVVYKLVPGLYHNEMQRRREFYLKNPEQIPATAPEQCGIEDRIIFSPDEIISLSLERLDREEYVFESIPNRGSEAGSDPRVVPRQLVLKKIAGSPGKGRKPGEASPRPKRYLRCPAAVEVSHLKKFIRMKYDLGERSKVDIIHKRVSLPDHYTLMDVAYIYTWKRNGPMRLFYYHGDPWTERAKAPEPTPEVAAEPVPEEKKPEIKAEEAREEVKEPEKVTETETPEAKPEPPEKPAEVLTNGIASECDLAVKTEKSDGEVNGKEAEAEKKEEEASAAVEAKSESNERVERAAETKTNETEPVPSKTSEPKKPEVKKDEKLKKTIANLLKNYRKDAGDGKVEAKSANGDGPTATRDKAVEKKEADVTIEIKSETKASEYDFESSSPPGKIIPLREFTKSEQSKNRKTENGRMSLQDFRNVMKENGESETGAETVPKPAKIRLVPSLKRIADSRKSPVQKANGKPEEPKKSPTIINIRTEEEYGRKENGAEKKDSPPPITIENRGGEYSIRHADENGKPEAKKRPAPEAIADTPKRPKTEDGCGAMDLTKTEAAESGRKNDENMVEALVSAAQKQNIEPLLRVPQFLKNSGTSPKTPKTSPPSEKQRKSPTAEKGKSPGKGGEQVAGGAGADADPGAVGAAVPDEAEPEEPSGAAAVLLAAAVPLLPEPVPHEAEPKQAEVA